MLTVLAVTAAGTGLAAMAMAVEEVAGARGTDQAAVDKRRSTGQLRAKLSSTDFVAPTRVWIDGEEQPELGSVEVEVKLENWLCGRVEPSGAVVVDMLCCTWEPEGNRGRYVLRERATFDHAPASKQRALVQECRRRNGARI